MNKVKPWGSVKILAFTQKVTANTEIQSILEGSEA